MKSFGSPASSPGLAPHSEDKLRYGYVASGFLTLLVGAYFDNVRGPLLPVLASKLAIPYADVGWFLTVGNLASLVLVLTLMPTLKRMSERSVTIAICTFGIAAGALAFATASFPSLLILGIAVGGSVATFGTICNILTIRGTPVAQRSRVLSGGHVMYGVGSLVAPLCVGIALERNIDWPWVVALGSMLSGAVAILAARVLPQRDHAATATPQRTRIEGLQILVVILFGVYVGGEVGASMWMVTYLNEGIGLDVTAGSQVMMGFFFVMALSRLSCFLALRPSWEVPVLWASLILPCAFFTLGYLGWHWGFALMGVIGPFFPVYLGRVSRAFPEHWRAIAVWVVFSIQAVLATFHLVVGTLTDWLGIRTSYLMSPAFLILTMILLACFLRREPAERSSAA